MYIFPQKAEQKLIEINNARNESMDALKSHREEFGLLRTKIHESMNKIKEYEELKKQKESEYKKILSSINEGKAKLENKLAQMKRWESESIVRRSFSGLIWSSGAIGLFVLREGSVIVREYKAPLSIHLVNYQCEKVDKPWR